MLSHSKRAEQLTVNDVISICGSWRKILKIRTWQDRIEIFAEGIRQVLDKGACLRCVSFPEMYK